MSMNNLLYQAYRHLYKKKQLKKQFKHSFNKFLGNIESYRTAKLFGTPKKLFIGDSNCEALDNFTDSRKFKDLTVVFGYGGTTPDDYVNFLRSREGENFYATLSIDKPLVVWNIGGNSVLQNKMDTCKKNLEILKSYFPKSWIFNLPPIHASVLEFLNPDPNRNIYEDLGTVNNWISEIWGDKVLDISSALLNPHTGEAFYGSLEDPVHYASATRQQMVKAINLLF
jgi:hypothetical protein